MKKIRSIRAALNELNKEGFLLFTAPDESDPQFPMEKKDFFQAVQSGL